MKWQIILAGLMARPVRTVVTMLAVALQVSLILVIVGLTTGTAKEIGRRVAGVGADVMFSASGADVILAMDSATLDPDLGPVIAKEEAVQSVTPVVVRFNTKLFTNIFGIDPVSFDQVSGGLDYSKGKVFSAPNEIVIDDIFAKDKKLDVGDPYQIQDRQFTVSGIVRNGKGARIFTTLDTAQQLANANGKVTLFFVKLRDASKIDAAIHEMDKDIPGYTIRNVPEYEALMNGQNIPGFDVFNEVVVFVALCIGILVIFLSMYTTIMERTREIGILRALGASKTFIVAMIMKESIFICVVGVVMGILGSFAISSSAKAVFPTLEFLIGGKWLVYAAISALVSGIVGSLHPALKAASQDPVEAFAYE